MIEWYKKVVFENYTNFKGRARRKEYWMFFLANAIISIVLGIVDGVSGLTFGAAETGILGLVYSLGVIAPSIAVSVRRMHDVGKSGWFIFIPIYNLILACTEGDKGVNEYGADPKNENELDQIGKE
ncbi:DUF805 domain-containing protein [Flavobacterium sp.]|uniref:DUF805 domain-containing protein n=1 Tax=Flavobacterium sp. TaxID=239 RepID=UPI003D0D08F0